MKEVLNSPLDQVPEGAELAVDLKDGQGRMLMRQGTVLSAEKLSALDRRGVETVPVYSGEVLDDATLRIRRTEIGQRVERRFAGHEEDALMQQLKTTVLEYRLEVLR